MNVAVFTDNDFDKVNGVTTALTAAVAHAPDGMRVRIYTASSCAADRPEYLALRSPSVPIPFYGEMRMYIPRLRRYRAHLVEDRIDLIHLTTPGPMGLAALWLARRRGIPLVGSFHTDLAAYTSMLSGSARLGALMGQYMRWMYGCCRRVLVPSDHTRMLIAETGVDPAKLQVWARGVDTDLFTPARRSETLRREWRVGPATPAIVYVGRLSKEKGLRLLAPVRERLRARGVDHRLILVGQGPLERELRAAHPDAIFTGVLSRERVADAFASADVMIFPSRTDTAGNVVLEAQASGLPVVVSADGGPRENMLSGSTGIVCQSDDPIEWANAIEAAMPGSGRHERMRIAARDYARQRQWAVALEPLYRAYRETRSEATATAPPGMLPMPIVPGR